MKRIRMPKEDVEYTFRFPPKKLFTYRWFGEQEGPNGRLILWNVTGKYYTKMTPQYFTYLCSNRFVKKEVVAAAEEKSETVSQLTEAKPEPKPEPIINAEAKAKEAQEIDMDKITPLNTEEIDALKGWIKRLEALNEDEKVLIRAKFPAQKEYRPDNLIAAMKYAITHGISNRGFGIMLMRYNRVDSEITTFFKKTI